MSDDLDQRPDADRLEELKVELSRHFGKFTRWKLLCVERGAEMVDAQIHLADEVLEFPSTGTNAEWLTYHLRLKGGKSFDVDEMLAGNDPAVSKEPRKNNLSNYFLGRMV